MFSRGFSSVPINDSEHEMLAGLRSLDHRSNDFFTCISGVDPALIMGGGGGGGGGREEGGLIQKVCCRILQNYSKQASFL